VKNGLSTAGVTLPEVAVTIAILAIITFTITQVNNGLSKINRTSQNSQLMSYDAISVLTYIARNLRSCGDGLRGIADPTFGKTVIAVPDDPMANSSSEFIFLSKDNDPVGTLGMEDQWTRYSVASDSGRDALMIRTYLSDNWLDIKSGVCAVATTNLIKVQDGVKISRLLFTLFDSQNPPRLANQDPYSASAVRVDLQLKKADVYFEQERTVTLENLLYGPR
jgi:prepilin-type N-terminal cleavage/methylation domain-containing protein